MADERDPSSPATHPLAKLDEPWRGDEHSLRLDAAREAGLETHDLELDLFTEGFKAGMTVKDPRDSSIVLRGRTVLRDKQLRKSLRPTLRFLGVSLDLVDVKVDDGEFELRIASVAAEQAQPVNDATKHVLKLWFGFGLLGLIAWNAFDLAWLATMLWGGALITGAVVLRRSVVSGRSMLAARLTVALALLAKEEKLILPPAAKVEG